MLETSGLFADADGFITPEKLQECLKHYLTSTEK
jgi:hypothetical protein